MGKGWNGMEWDGVGNRDGSACVCALDSVLCSVSVEFVSGILCAFTRGVMDVSQLRFFFTDV